MHFVYLLFSEKLNKFYTGETKDINLRMEFHKLSLPKKYTASTQDWKIFLIIQCECKTQALKIEKHIKAMKSATYKKNLKKYPEISSKLKQKYPC